MNGAWARRFHSTPLSFWLVLAVFAAVTIPQAILRPLWYDELSARWVSSAPTFADLVARAVGGLEPVPPLYLSVQYVFLRLFGTSELAGRLPSILGFTACLVFLYRFTAWRLGACGGAIAMAVMTLSGAVYYAQEGRPYGMVFGCAAAAIWSWQRYTAEGSARHVWYCAIALFTCPSLHYYAVLLSVPFFLAEVARWFQTRRFDWKMAIAVAAPSTAMLVHLPLIRLVMSGQSNPARAWGQPTLAFPAKFWERALEPGMLVFVGLLVAIVYLRAFAAAAGPEERPAAEPRSTLPVAEFVLLCGFVLLPVAGMVFAKLVTNAIAPRYVFSAMIGAAALAAHAAAYAVPTGRHWVMLLLLAAAGGNGALDVRWMLREGKPGGLDIPTVAAHPDLPVVIDDYLLYAVLTWYAPEPIRSRIVYLTDPERLSHYTRAGQMELIAVTATKGGMFRGQAGYLVPYLAEHPRFLLYEPLDHPGNESWLNLDLLDRGVKVTLISIQGGGRWYLVERS